MTKRSKILLVSAACAIVAVIVAIQVIQFSRKLNEHVVNLTDEQARVIIKNQLTQGASKFSVEKFLGEEKWPYTDDGSTVQAVVRDASHTFLVRDDLVIRFSFDPKDKLKSYSITHFLTGP
jgi:hypothetical protein